MQIARRQRVTNLREIWPRETDFSDWLVTEDGLALIAEDIGIEVEDPTRECRPGDFPCDIVGHVLGDDDHKVVIENQFGKTNHDHLGKLLTYAAMNTATIAIWLSEEISGDHRKVIDWLNDNTPPNVGFYLAQVKAYRIGNSPVAPELDVVSRPNFEVKLQREDTSQGLKDRHIWRKQFWEEILNYIAGQQPPFRLQSPGTGDTSHIAVGRSGFRIYLALTPKHKRIGCGLYIRTSWKDSAYAQLEAQRTAIEEEIGETLQWRPIVGEKAAEVLLEAAIDPKDDSNRDQVKQWMHKQSVAFYKAFQPRVKNLMPPLDDSLNDMDDLSEVDS